MSTKHKSIIEVRKIKSASSFASTYSHNLDNEFRKLYVDNANPDLCDLNEVLVPMDGKTYEERFEELCAYMKENNAFQRTLRSDAVLGIEIVTTFSPELLQENVDIKKWKEENLEFIREAFNPKVHRNRLGEEIECDNVISSVLHVDEGNYHMHTVVIPFNENGELCGSDYLRKDPLKDIVYLYHERMKSFGLTMETGSHSRPMSNKEYNMNQKRKVVKAPEILENESITEYQNRMSEFCTNLKQTEYRKQLDLIHENEKNTMNLSHYRKIAEKYEVPGDNDFERARNMSATLEKDKTIKDLIKNEPSNELVQAYADISSQLFAYADKKRRKKKEVLYPMHNVRLSTSEPNINR